MIIGLDLYEVLKVHVEKCIRSNLPVKIEDAFDFDVPFDSLSSLYSQLSLRNASAAVYQGDAVREAIFRRIENGEESLLERYQHHPKGGYTFAKHFLEFKFGKDFKVATFLENPSIVDQSILRYDLLKMIAEDFNNSVKGNLIKESTGKDYEDLLVELLRNRKMCFETEEESRAKGKPKTPDILFLVPMAISKGKYDPSDLLPSNPNSISGGTISPALTSGLKKTPTKRSTSVQSISYQPDDYLVINWIDSKAMFADRKTFQDHLVQLESYRNRYGRGMVIYWHGVVEDVFSMLTDDMIIIRDSFPDEWIFPSGEPADGRTPVFDAENFFER